MEDLEELDLANFDLALRHSPNLYTLKQQLAKVAALLSEVADKELNVKFARQIKARVNSDAKHAAKKIDEIINTLNFLTATVSEFTCGQRIKRVMRRKKSAP